MTSRIHYDLAELSDAEQAQRYLQDNLPKIKAASEIVLGAVPAGVLSGDRSHVVRSYLMDQLDRLENILLAG